MPTVSETQLIPASQQRVFDLTQDYDLRLTWDPFLRSIRWVGDTTAPGKGARVAVRAWNGLTMQVRYITWQPPRLVAMTMERGPFFFRTFAGSWKIEEAGGSQARVTFQYSFKTRWKALRWLLDPAIRWVFGRDLKQRLRGLAGYVAQHG